MREEPRSGGMRKWSRFSLGCKVCDNYLRKHREGRAGFTLDPTASAGCSCVAAAGLEHDFPALPNPGVPRSFLPRNSQESMPDPTRHLGFFLPVGSALLHGAVIAPNAGFQAAGSSVTPLNTD